MPGVSSSLQGGRGADGQETTRLVWKLVLRQCHDDNDQHNTTRHEAARATSSRQEGGGGEVQRPREVSMPRGEGVYGSSVDQSGKATGRIQGAGQGYSCLHPAPSLLGSSPLPIKGAVGTRQSSVAGKVLLTPWRVSRRRGTAPHFTGCTTRQHHRIVPRPPCSSQVRPPLGKSDIFDAWPLLDKGKRGRGETSDLE